MRKRLHSEQNIMTGVYQNGVVFIDPKTPVEPDLPAMLSPQ